MPVLHLTASVDEHQEAKRGEPTCEPLKTAPGTFHTRTEPALGAVAATTAVFEETVANVEVLAPFKGADQVCEASVLSAGSWVKPVRQNCPVRPSASDFVRAA